MKVALVHDYLKEYGGAERVVEALHEIFPEAPVYTAYLDLKGLGKHAKRFEGWDIRTSWIQKLPLAGKLISPLRLLAPAAFESFDLSEYDLVISSCAIYFAKAVITKPETLHLCYIHTPPRYLYGYATSYNYKKHWWTRVGGELMNHFLRLWDFETSQRPDILIANSKNVASRIKKFYRRDSVVIYPPVNVILASEARPESDSGQVFDREAQTESAQDTESNRSARVTEKGYFLSLGRLVRGKGTEVIVEACSKLNLPLKVAGAGPELERLKKIAGKATSPERSRRVEFLGAVTDEERVKLYQEAKAFILASEDEDFGITAVEAQAAGIPVIAPKTGGYLETVIEGKTGMFYPKVTVEDLRAALEKFDPKKFKPEDCIKQAEKFSSERFKKEIIDLIKRKTQNSNVKSQN